jgi:hypothetical protein
MWFSFLMLTLGVAVGAPPGFEFLKTAGECAYYFQERPGDGVSVMRAECAWPEVGLVSMRSMLRRFDAYDEYIFPIEVSETREVSNGKSLVFQRHKVFGFAPRETLIWMAIKDSPPGFEVTWSAAEDRGFRLQPGAVQMRINEGFWLVAARVGGGVTIAHEVRVDAGAGCRSGWCASFGPADSSAS